MIMMSILGGSSQLASGGKKHGDGFRGTLRIGLWDGPLPNGQPSWLVNGVHHHPPPTRGVGRSSSAWAAKVMELAERGVTVRELLSFYRALVGFGAVAAWRLGPKGFLEGVVFYFNFLVFFPCGTSTNLRFFSNSLPPKKRVPQKKHGENEVSSEVFSGDISKMKDY